MKRAVKMAIGMAVPAVLLCLASLHLMCRDGQDPSADARNGDAPLAAGATTSPDETLTATAAPTTLPAGPTSVRVSIEMVIHKKYGTLAHISGKRDVTITDQPYDEAKSWWDNPMVIHQDAAFRNSARNPGGLAAGADSATIGGSGSSSNVSVDLTLVPHADITLNTLAVSDCLKGTITATITTESDYFDGKWTPVARAKDSPVSFDFDTSDKSRPLRPTTRESRAMPPFVFERYIRDREKWEPRSAWPASPKSGDWRSSIYVKDAKLLMTGYQYADRPPAAATTAAVETRESASTTPAPPPAAKIPGS
jgi:hypothetical protein